MQAFNFSKFDSFFFDFDGLLVDTESLHYHSYLEMVETQGFQLDWDFTTYLTHALKSTAALRNGIYSATPGLFEKESEWDVLRSQKQAIYKQKLLDGHLKFMEGAKELLAKLSNLPIKKAVVTNSPKEQTDVIRKFLPELNVIELWVTRELYNEAKPSPDSYLKALELTNSTTAVGFEDSLKGINSLLQTSIQPVYIKPKCYPANDPLPSRVWKFSSLMEVLPLHNTLV